MTWLGMQLRRSQAVAQRDSAECGRTGPAQPSIAATTCHHIEEDPIYSNSIYAHGSSTIVCIHCCRAAAIVALARV